METTFRAKCVCKNDFQDERYGTGIRIHNVRKQQSEETEKKMVIEGKCTVCGIIRKA